MRVLMTSLEMKTASCASETCGNRVGSDAVRVLSSISQRRVWGDSEVPGWPEWEFQQNKALPYEQQGPGPSDRDTSRGALWSWGAGGGVGDHAVLVASDDSAFFCAQPAPTAKHAAPIPAARPMPATSARPVDELPATILD